MGKLQDFQLKIGFNENMFMHASISPYIFHYTSPSGFESILFGDRQNTVLWASRYDCLNDSSEGAVAQERYVSVCNEMLATGELNKDLYDILATVKPAYTTLMWYRTEEKDVLSRTEYTRYVCSFSKNKDSLAMWNYYSKGSKYEGFNLGFYSSELLKSIQFKLQSYESKVRLYPIVYDKSQQERLIRDFICKVSENFESGEEAILRYMASEQLSRWALTFKNECFMHEEEVRLIVDLGIKKYGMQKDIPQLPVNYRIANGYTIPYIKLPFDKYCLSDVTIGPLICSDTNKKTQIAIMNERLTSEDYQAIINHSVIPIRY